MYDIKPLEEEWEKYRRKKRKPYIFTGVAILVLLFGVSGLYYFKEKLFSFTDKNSTKKIHSKTIVFSEDKSLNKLEVEAPVRVLEAEQEEASTEIVEDLPISDGKPVRKKPRVKINIVTTEMPKVKKHSSRRETPHKRVHLAITETSGPSAYKELERRFKETQDTDDSLFLAKAYYRQHKYKKAEYWALQTNNINANIEESILIFAKAKVKLGRKHEAIRILSKYIQQTGSVEAKMLLIKIKKGKV